MDITDQNFTIQKVIASKKLPRFIYKYYSNEKNRLQDTLNNQTIWFSKPKVFNDPFDCMLKVDTDNTEEEIIEYVNYLCIKNNISGSRRLKLISNFLIPGYRFTNTNKSIENAVLKSGVSCFSKNKNNIIMWSHYANSHQGYCLKFDLLKDPNFFMIPMIVKYKKKYPYFNFIRNNKDLFKFTFGYKYNDWRYEEEIRIARQEQGNVKINPESIVEISFGINCNPDDINLIKKYALKIIIVMFRLRKLKEKIVFLRLNLIVFK